MASTTVTNRRSTFDNNTNADYPVRKTVVDSEDVQHVFLENSFKIPSYDSVEVTYPTATQEVYTFKNSGSTVGTITINYTDATKDFISDATKT